MLGSGSKREGTVLHIQHFFPCSSSINRGFKKSSTPACGETCSFSQVWRRFLAFLHWRADVSYLSGWVCADVQKRCIFCPTWRWFFFLLYSLSFKLFFFLVPLITLLHCWPPCSWELPSHPSCLVRGQVLHPCRASHTILLTRLLFQPCSHPLRILFFFGKPGQRKHNPSTAPSPLSFLQIPFTIYLHLFPSFLYHSSQWTPHYPLSAFLILSPISHSFFTLLSPFFFLLLPLCISSCHLLYPPLAFISLPSIKPLHCVSIRFATVLPKEGWWRK